MIDLEDQAQWMREQRSNAFWRGVIIGAATMLLLTTCVGCSTFTPERVQKAAFVVIGGSIVATALANGHGSKAPGLAVGPPPALPCHPQPDGSCR